MDDHQEDGDEAQLVGHHERSQHEQEQELAAGEPESGERVAPEG